MASPQCENGYIRIAKEIAEALMTTNLSAYQSRFLWALWYKTYGWNKKEDWISNSQLVAMTGLAKGNVSRTQKELLMRNIIVINSDNKMAFQKNYSWWGKLDRGVRGDRCRVINSDNTGKVINSGKSLSIRVPPVINSGEHKRKNLYIIKTLLSQLIISTYFTEDSKPYLLSQKLLDLILKRKPTFKKPDLQKWAIHIDRMIRLDKREPKNIEAIIRWCQQDDFWQNNILSTEKLRKQFDQLEMKMDKDPGNGIPQESDAYKQYLESKEQNETSET